MSRPPKSKTAEWRRLLTSEEAARIDTFDRHIARLQAEIAEYSEMRRELVARGMNRWQYEKRKGGK